MSPDLAPVLTRIEAIEDPIERATAAQTEIAALGQLRDEALRQAWRTRRAGTQLSALARTVGVTRTTAALAVSREGQS